MSRLGHDRERAVKGVLEGEGWTVIRAAGSLGIADLVALRRVDGIYTECRLIEVKATSDAGPFRNFGPARRRELREAAERIGATAWLFHWPKRKQLNRIGADEWPS